MTKFEKYINRLPKDLVKSLKDCMQDAKWHPEGSVYNHVKLVFEFADKKFNGDGDLLAAAIFHDLGKPETTRTTGRNGEAKITHYGHEFASLKFIDKYFDLFSDLSTDREKVVAICKNHMRAHMYDSGVLSKPTKRAAFEADKYFKTIMDFRLCDENGRN